MTPPDAATLRELAERIEAAEEPDRELDLDLWNALTGEHWEWLSPNDFLKIGRHEIARQNHEVVRWLKGEGRHEEAMRMEFGPCPSDLRKPAFLTSSLDASAAILDRFGMTWSKSMEGFVCVHDREGAGTFRPDTASAALPVKLVSGAVRALLARADAGQGDGA